MTSSQHERLRTTGVKKSIIAGFLGKGTGFLINLMLVPLSLNYLGKSEYGIWVTIASMLLWLNFFDLGFSLGLQNKLTIALAHGKTQEAKKLVSSVFFIFMIISVVLLILGGVFVFTVPWTRVFSAPNELAGPLLVTVIIVIVFFVLQFPLSIVDSIYAAFQQKYKQIFWKMSSSIVLLLAVFIVTRFRGGLVNLAAATTGSYLVIRIVNSVYVYFYWKKDLLPQRRFFDKNLVKKMTGLSLSFMGLQIAAIISYQADSFIILKTLGPETVTQYSVAQRLFTTLLAFHALLGNPFWPAITDAYARGDMGWIRKAVNRLIKMTVILMAPVLVILLLFGAPLMKFWLGDASYYSSGLFALLGVISFSMAFQAIYSYLLNGCSKPFVLMKFTLFTTPLYLVCALVGIRFWGVNGFIAAKILVNTGIILIVQIIYANRKIFGNG